MSVPGAMSPVEIDGRLLVDGGIANNLPIDEARKLCADVVIAVDISTPPLKREEITSALTVSRAAHQLPRQGHRRAAGQEPDRQGRPDLAGSWATFPPAASTAAKDSIRIGEEAARAVADRLRRYSLPPEQYAALRARRPPNARTSAPSTRSASRDCSARIPEVLRSLVQTKPGEPLSEEKIGADLRRIYGRGDFESVDYRIMQEPGTRVMIIQPREKDWGPDYLRFGLGLATDFQGEAPFTVLVQYRKTWLNRLGGEWLTEAQIGRDNPPVHRVLPAGGRARPLVRRSLRQRRTDHPRRFRRRGPRRRVRRQGSARGHRRRRRARHLGRAAARAAVAANRCRSGHRLAGAARRSRKPRPA